MRIYIIAMFFFGSVLLAEEGVWHGHPTLVVPLGQSQPGEFAFEFSLLRPAFERLTNNDLLPIVGGYRKNDEVTRLFYGAYDIRFRLGRGGRGMKVLVNDRPSILFSEIRDDVVVLKALGRLSTEYDLLTAVSVEMVNMDPAGDGSKPPQSVIYGISLK